MYQLSKNYEQLYSMLLAGEEVACFVTNKNIKRIGFISINNDMVFIESTGGVHSVIIRQKFTIEWLTAACTRLNLQFIPQIDVKQVAGDGFSAAIQWAYENQPYLENCWAENAKEQYLNTL